MPGPPPPPPPGAPPPMMPPPVFSSGGKGGPDERSALLQSIRKGAKLKKTVTNDKSAPLIGKVSNSNNANSSHVGAGGGSTAFSAPIGLGGLFAGGMPKLKPTGTRQLGSVNNSLGYSNNNKPETPPQPKNFSTIQSELRKQMANDSKNRGPPPPAPVRNYNTNDDSSSRQPFVTKNGSSQNGFHQNPSLPNLAAAVQNAHHRKTQSNVNVSVSSISDAVDNVTENVTPRPSINYGKPNLAPKPPILNGKPQAPPKKLLMNGKQVGRAQSMRSPRSPSPQSPENNNPEYNVNKFGTVRNLSSMLNHSLGNLNQVKPRTPLNGRPTAPPPSVPSSAPPPPSKTVRPPNHAPPPPPIASIPQIIPQAPTQAPPPPPHRPTIQTPSRAPPAIPISNAPPPPPRHSSIRDIPAVSRRSSSASVTGPTCDLEARFIFRPPSEFPKPMAFRGIQKTYTSRQVGSKQQAPLPPNQIQLTNRLWESSTC